MARTMTKRASKRPPIRKIHINLPEEVHQKLRVKCALEDVTIQEYVSSLIKDDLRKTLSALQSEGRSR